MKKKTMAVSAIGIAAMLAISGCSGAANTDTDGKTVLTFMERYPEDAYAPYFEKVAKAYEAKHPDVTVKITAVGNDHYWEKLTLLTGQKKLPDVFWATPGNHERQFVKAGLAHDFSNDLAQDGWGDSFDKVTLASYKMNDGVYGIPLQSNYKFLAYNPTILEKAGVKVPSTIEQLLTTCDTLRKTGVTPVAFGNAEGWPAMHYMTVLNGYYVPSGVREKDYSSVDKPGAWENKGYVKALDAFADIQKHCFAQGSATASFDAARTSFLNGSAAMYAGSFGEIKLISDKTDPSAFPKPWGIANMPAPAHGAGDSNAVAGAGNGVMVKKGDHTKVAVDFVRFMTNLDNAAKLPSETGFISAVAKANTPDNTIQQTSDFLSDVVANADEVNMWLDNALPGKVSSTYSSSLQGFLGGQVTAEQIIKKLRTTKP